MTVAKENMTVVRQDRLGLSPFGFLSGLFQEELEQRLQRQTAGAYEPLPLTLLEDQEGQDQPAQPMEVEVNLEVHVDAPKQPAAARPPEEKPAPRGPAVKPADLEARILEKVRVQERQLRQKQEVIHRLEVRLESRQTQVQTLVMPGRQTGSGREAAAAPGQGRPSPAAGADPAGPGQGIQTIRQARKVSPIQTVSAAGTAGQPPRALSLASQAASVPAAGGWAPEMRQAHPGYPSTGLNQPREGQGEGGSILLPDVLRRRRAQALERQAEPQLEWARQPGMPDGASDALMQAVHQAVEKTLEQNHTRAPGPVPGESAAPPEQESGEPAANHPMEKTAPEAGQSPSLQAQRSEIGPALAEAGEEALVYHSAPPERESGKPAANHPMETTAPEAGQSPSLRAQRSETGSDSGSHGESILPGGEQLPGTSHPTPAQALQPGETVQQAAPDAARPAAPAESETVETLSTALPVAGEKAPEIVPGETLIYRENESPEEAQPSAKAAAPAVNRPGEAKAEHVSASVQKSGNPAASAPGEAARAAAAPAGRTVSAADRSENEASMPEGKAAAAGQNANEKSVPEGKTASVSAPGQNAEAAPAETGTVENLSTALPVPGEKAPELAPGETLVYREAASPEEAQSSAGAAVPAVNRPGQAKAGNGSASVQKSGSPAASVPGEAAKAAAAPAGGTVSAAVRSEKAASMPEGKAAAVAGQNPNEKSMPESKTVSVLAPGQNAEAAPAETGTAETLSTALPVPGEKAPGFAPGETLIYREAASPEEAQTSAGAAVPAVNRPGQAKAEHVSASAPQNGNPAASAAREAARAAAARAGGTISAADRSEKAASMPEGKTSAVAGHSVNEKSMPESKTVSVLAPGQNAEAAPAEAETAESLSTALPVAGEKAPEFTPGETLVYREAASPEEAQSSAGAAVPAVSRPGQAKAENVSSASVQKSGSPAASAAREAAKAAAAPAGRTVSASAAERSVKAASMPEGKTSAAAGQNVNEKSMPESKTVSVSAPGQNAEAAPAEAETVETLSTALPVAGEKAPGFVPGETLIYRETASPEEAQSSAGAAAPAVNRPGQAKAGNGSASAPQNGNPAASAASETAKAAAAPASRTAAAAGHSVNEKSMPEGKTASVIAPGQNAEAVPAESETVETFSTALPVPGEKAPEFVPGETLVYRETESLEEAQTSAGAAVPAVSRPGQAKAEHVSAAARGSTAAAGSAHGRSQRAGLESKTAAAVLPGGGAASAAGDLSAGGAMLARPASSEREGMRDIRLVHTMAGASAALAGVQARGREAAQAAFPQAIPVQAAATQAAAVQAASKEGLSGVRDIRLIHALPRGGQAGSAAPEAGSGPAGPQPEGGQEEQPSLVLARPAPAREQAEAGSDQTRNLPDWARNLLARDQKAQQAGGPAGGAGQVQWTAPYARPGQAQPARLSGADELPPPLLHHKQEETEEQKARRQAEKDAELRRTADKVYRIIEERLRRELRRSGR